MRGRIRIAVDAAGPEPGHRIVIDGAAAAIRDVENSEAPLQVVFYGPSKPVREHLAALDLPQDSVEVVNAPDIISQSDRPSDVLHTKKASSIVRAIQHLATGAVTAFVSMGNTGAVVGAARTYLGRIRWISKPALAAPLPRVDGAGLLLDIGATSDPKPNHLVQFAAMGVSFVENVYKVQEPTVGLLNIGAESHKGNELTKDAYKLLAKSSLPFIGNIEGGELFSGKADVVVTNGFVGNILLKQIESIPSLLHSRVRNYSWANELFEALHDLESSRYGGAMLLGVDGPVIIGHGQSDVEAVRSAILWARKSVRANLLPELKDRVFRARRALWLSNPFSRLEGSEDEA